MGTRLNRQTYAKLIEENISELEKYMPEHSLEKKHTIDVLRWSIKAHYDDAEKTDMEISTLKKQLINQRAEILEEYNKFLMDNGYADSDLVLEKPTAIDQFLEQLK